MNKAKTNLSLLWLTGIFSAILAFATQTIIARNVDLHVYGAFSASLASVVLIAPVAGFGACKLLLRVFGENDAVGKSKYTPILKYILVTSFISYLIFACISAINPEGVWWQFVLGVHIFGLLAVELITANNQIQNNVTKVSVWQLIPNLVRFLLIVLMMGMAGLSLGNVVAAYAISSIICVVFSVIDVRLFLSGFLNAIELANNKIGKYSVFCVFKDSWPYGLASLVHLIIYQSDIVLLGYLDTKEVTGLYNISFLILTAIYLLPAIAYQKLYLPLVHRWAFHDKDKLVLFFKRGNRLMLASGLVLNLVLYWVAEYLINVAFGHKYAGAVEILRLLSFSVPFMFVVYCCGPILTTKNNIKKKINIMMAVALINIVLNVIFIPIYSYVGACASTIFCSMLLAYLYYAESARIVGSRSVEI